MGCGPRGLVSSVFRPVVRDAAHVPRAHQAARSGWPEDPDESFPVIHQDHDCRVELTG